MIPSSRWPSWVRPEERVGIDSASGDGVPLRRSRWQRWLGAAIPSRTEQRRSLAVLLSYVPPPNRRSEAIGANAVRTAANGDSEPNGGRDPGRDPPS